MKNTIEGFSQSYALTLKMETESRGKMVTKKIDCTDLAILRWFVDFYPSMRKTTIDGKVYAWVYYQKIIDDIPIIDISRRSLADRLQKMVEFGLLEYRLADEIDGKAGTYTTYGFGENYMNLVEEGGCCSNNRGVCESNDRGGDDQTAPKDSSVKDYSTKERIDIDKSACRAIPNIWTIELIECGYLKEDDPRIEDCNAFLEDVWWEKDQRKLESAIRYFKGQYSIRKGLDEFGNPIGDRIAYLKESISSGIRMLESAERMASQQ